LFDSAHLLLSYLWYRVESPWERQPSLYDQTIGDFQILPEA
jgi:hypothetical protein